MKIVLRNLAVRDLEELTSVHRRAFPTSDLTLLGRGAVRRYYEWLLLGPHQVTAIGAFHDGRFVGFLVGGLFYGAESGFLKRHRAYLAFCALLRPWLFLRADFRRKVADSLSKMKRWNRASQESARKGIPEDLTKSFFSGSFGVLSIAVDPRCQNSGVGKVLMRKVEETARRLGFREMDLTVTEKNEQALHFYEKLGWVKCDTAGAWRGVMKKSLARGVIA